VTGILDRRRFIHARMCINSNSALIFVADNASADGEIHVCVIFREIVREIPRRCDTSVVLPSVNQWAFENTEGGTAYRVGNPRPVPVKRKPDGHIGRDRE
jgi:hypothetical protein